MASFDSLPAPVDQADLTQQVEAVPITPSVLKTMRISKVFHDNKHSISSLAYDTSGQVCITTSPDESLHLYDCCYGRLRKTLFSKKYGADLARFTHHSNNIIYASAKGNDHALRYLSLHDNQYLMYFAGHEQQVVGLQMSPVDDTFLSAARDRTVRLWDLKSPHCQGIMHLPEAQSRPCIAFDPYGLIFAVGLDQSQSIRLYDVKNFDAGPFSTFQLDTALCQLTDSATAPQWTGVKCSPDGKQLLIITQSDSHFVLDAYTGAIQYRLMGHVPIIDSRGDEVTFSPDGRFVLAGSQDGAVCIWQLGQPEASKTSTLQPLCTLEGHLDPTKIVGFNPRYMLLGTGCTDLALWEPENLR